MLADIGQIAVTVKDVDRAVAFYRDTLGMTLLFQAPPGLAFFGCGSVRLMLSKPEKPEFDHPASIIYYRVADIGNAASELASKGVSFIHEPAVVHRTDTEELWMGFFKDSEDNTLALMSEVPIEA